MSLIDLRSMLENLLNHSDTHEEPPSGWVPLADRGLSPMPGEVESALAAAQELAELEGYAETFGGGAPDREALVASLVAGHHASVARRRAQAWLEYLADQEARAWKHALPLVAQLRLAWQPVASVERGVGQALPALAALMTTRSLMAKRAVRTRVRRQSLKAKAGKEPSMPKPTT